MLMLATFMITFAFLAFFVFAATFMVFAALMVAFTFVTFFVFAFSFVLATFMVTFFAALRFWHVGFHLFHFLCHVDSFSSLFLIEVFPVGESLHHDVHLSHHFRAHWRHLMIALMMFVALLFLVFAAFFLFFVFLFVAA